jgi:NTP pyrophosphatase (non-canonical NTP hydrolase)
MEFGTTKESAALITNGVSRPLEPDYAGVINKLAQKIYTNNVKVGWYTDPVTMQPIERSVPEMLMLCVSELAEALEGHRKNLMDDHLPKYPMITTELADTLIRLCDLAGYQKLDLGDAVVDKLAYNATRADHKLSARQEVNGKKF